MAINQKKAAAVIDSIIKNAEELKKLLGVAAPAEAAEEGAEGTEETTSEGVELPPVKDLKKMNPKQLKALATELNIEVSDETDIDDLRKTLVLASNFANGGEVSDTDLKLLAIGLGLAPSKKADANRENIRNYLSISAPETEAEADAEASSDEDAAPAEDAEASTDDAEASSDEEATASTDEDATTDDAEADAEPEAEDTADDEAPAEEEISDKDKKARVAAFNKVSKKPVKNYAELETRMSYTDDEGNEVVATWGVPYIKDEEYYCCGRKLADVKHKGKDAGKCVVTGGVFILKDEKLVKVA